MTPDQLWGISETRSESRNDALDKCRELMERFEQRLCLNNLRLIERYIKSELQILIQFRIGSIDEEFIACLQGEENVGGLEKSIKDRKLGSVERIIGISGGGPFHHPLHMSAKIDALKHGANCDQKAVLLDVVKSIENPEKIISSFVWFERIDRGERVLSRALYLSLFFGFVFRGVVRNRKINPIGIWRCVPGIGTDKLVGEMIDGTHQILNDVSCNER